MLTAEPITFDQLTEMTLLDTGTLHMAIMQLEIKAHVKKLPGNRYIRS
jgi:predicted Rossmann fold nucleotide-binding protein DprA/Smf involved in DNA uptake